MNMNALRTGVRIQREALGEVAGRPLHHLGLVAGAAVTAGVAPLWGQALSTHGWMEARRRMPAEGLVALGQILIPQRARPLYADGVWRGLWRVHGLSLALACVQAPAVALAMLPAFLAYQLLAPAAGMFPDPVVAMAVAQGLPALLGLALVSLVAGQTLLVLRLLGQTHGASSLGQIARTSSEAWRVALQDLPTLATLGLSLVVVGAMGAAFVYANLRLALWLELGAGVQLVTTWAGAITLLLVAALSFEVMARWAERVDVNAPVATHPFSFTTWLTTWLRSVVAWFAARGMVSMGTAVVLAVGGLTALLALLSGQTFTSWVGLGWFAASAAVLVVLHVTGRRS
ncbi:MAG: hypothetical protein ABIJ09_22060 [Pseudomonadota bacterium]